MRLSILTRAGALAVLGMAGCTQILGIGGDFKKEGSGGATSTSTGTGMTNGSSTGTNPTTTTVTGSTTSTMASSSTGGTAMCTVGNVATTIYTASGALVDDRRLFLTQQPAGVGNNYIYAVMAPAPPNMSSNDLVIVTLQGNSGVRGVVHYAGLTNMGIDVGGVVATGTSLVIFLRVGNELGELVVPTDSNGATDPGTYPANFTSWGQPCAAGQYMNDFKVRKPLTASTTNYVARCNDNTTQTESLFLGNGTAGGNTIDSAPANDSKMRLSEYLRVGNSDVIFNGDDPTKGTFVRTGDVTTLGATHPVDVEGVAGRSSVFFTSTPIQTGMKMFFATLDSTQIVPAKLFRIDITEATLPNLWAVPMTGTTNTATLSAQTDLVKWDPISPIGPAGMPPTGYVAGGADVAKTSAKFIWLNAAGDFVILNKTVAQPMNVDVLTAQGIAIDQLNTLVVWSEYDGTNAVIKTKNVLCTGS